MDIKLLLPTPFAPIKIFILFNLKFLRDFMDLYPSTVISSIFI